jgi:hypothetical protein
MSGSLTYDSGYRGPCPTEDQEQVTFFNQLRKRYPDTWGALALHPRNEGARTHSQAQRHKAEGLTPGAADIIIPARVAFVCELKRQDRTKSRIGAEQAAYLAAAANAGAFACVAYGWAEAWRALEDWQRAIQERP